MMNIFSIVGIALVGCALAILLKQYKPEYAMMVSLACGILIFLMILDHLLPVFDSVTNLMDNAGINSEYAKAIIKALGICYVVQMAADSCRDSGESALAGKVELAGKVAIIIIALPLFESLVELALSLINL